MANRATLPQCLVFIDERTSLLRMTFEARFVFTHERKTPCFEGLLNVCRRAFNRDTFVHLVTISAAHFAFRDRMVMRQRERSANFQVTLETSLGRLSWIDDGTSAAAGFHVQTSRPVARFTAHVRDLLLSFAALFAAFSAALGYDYLFRLQSRVGGRSEVAHDLLMAGGAFFRADKFRSWDAWWRENCSVGRAAGKQNYGQRYGSTGTPQQPFALTLDPSS